MKKKKKIKYHLDYYVVLPSSRYKHEGIFSDDCLQVFKSKAVEQYLKTNRSKIESMKVLNWGTGILLRISIHPDVAISNVVYNLKRLVYKDMYALVNDKLNGRRNVWSLDYVIGQNEDEAYKLFMELTVDGADVI